MKEFKTFSPISQHQLRQQISPIWPELILEITMLLHIPHHGLHGIYTPLFLCRGLQGSHRNLPKWPPLGIRPGSTPRQNSHSLLNTLKIHPRKQFSWFQSFIYIYSLPISSVHPQQLLTVPCLCVCVWLSVCLQVPPWLQPTPLTFALGTWVNNSPGTAHKKV